MQILDSQPRHRGYEVKGMLEKVWKTDKYYEINKIILNKNTNNINLKVIPKDLLQKVSRMHHILLGTVPLSGSFPFMSTFFFAALWYDGPLYCAPPGGCWTPRARSSAPLIGGVITAAGSTVLRSTWGEGTTWRVRLFKNLLCCRVWMWGFWSYLYKVVCLDSRLS